MFEWSGRQVAIEGGEGSVLMSKLHMMTQSLSLPPFPPESSLSGPLRNTDPGPPGWTIGVLEFVFSRCAARLSPLSAARLYQEIALWKNGTRESVTMVPARTRRIYPLFHIRRCPDSNLQEIANSVHCLYETCLGGSFGPEVRFCVRLREDAR